MGNILCFPKHYKKSDHKAGKKQRKRSSKKNHRANDNQKDERDVTFGLEDDQPSNESVDQTDRRIKRSICPEIYVCPVVSSSILLRLDHEGEEDEDIGRKLSKDHDEKEPVNETKQSLDIETRPTATDDTSSKLCTKNEKSMVASVERLSGDITPTAQDEPVATVRVINVREVNRNLSLDSAHVETNTEALVESVQSAFKTEDVIASNKSIELHEENKRSESKTTSTVSSGLYSEIQKDIDKQHLICTKTVEGGSKEIYRDTTSEEVKVVEDEGNIERSRFKVEKVVEPTTPEVGESKSGCEKENSIQTRRIRKLPVVEMIDSYPTINKSNMLDVQNVTNICVKSKDKATSKLRENIKGTTSQRQDTNISSPVVANRVTEIEALARMADVESPPGQISSKGMEICPVVSEKRPVASQIKEIGALLNVLSALPIPAEKSNSDPVVPASGTKRHVFGPQSDSFDKLGVYKSKQGIETWIQQSNPGTSSPLRKDNNTPVPSTSFKKVSDFLVPWKPRKLPQKPLSLKKPSSHLYKIPDIAKSESNDDKVNWAQVEPKGPQTEVLWTNKPSAFDVKLPPLPKRLLERKGSVEKLQEMWILPQVKQIETLKREYGRFPGLVVPTSLRQNYSVNIKKVADTVDENDNSDEKTYRNTNDADSNQETDEASKSYDN